MDVLDKIRRLVVSRRVIYSYHSVIEKLEEINHRRRLNLTEDDIDEAILNGQIVEVFDNDRRGKRYAVKGCALDGVTVLEVVCRIRENLVIITVYEPYY